MPVGDDRLRIMKILIVCDEPSAAAGIAGPLREAGHVIDIVDRSDEADAVLRGGHFDDIVLDLRRAPGAALEWLRGLRQRRVRLPALVVTEADAADTRIAAIEAGADDHLQAPFDPRELVARCQALVRRNGGASRSDVITCGELVVDSRRRELRHGCVPIDLTPREWSILEYLVLNAGTAVTKERLLRAIAGFDEQLAPNAIEVYVSRLRTKLAGTGARISTLRGVGYRLEQPQENAGHAPW
ncbi:MAG: response regulator transcription factor [Burkholderiaceae bacterium]|nr:response regulator transcription factor [Burkholderiaceae bacterium]MEB2349974.1 response regulator transcription factor [Burkholderiaceae bacterium]